MCEHNGLMEICFNFYNLQTLKKTCNMRSLWVWICKKRCNFLQQFHVHLNWASASLNSNRAAWSSVDSVHCREGHPLQGLPVPPLHMVVCCVPDAWEVYQTQESSVSISAPLWYFSSWPIVWLHMTYQQDRATAASNRCCSACGVVPVWVNFTSHSIL